jgi:hypothetical protein
MREVIQEEKVKFYCDVCHKEIDSLVIEIKFEDNMYDITNAIYYHACSKEHLIDLLDSRQFKKDVYTLVDDYCTDVRIRFIGSEFKRWLGD